MYLQTFIDTNARDAEMKQILCELALQSQKWGKKETIQTEKNDDTSCSPYMATLPMHNT